MTRDELRTILDEELGHVPLHDKDEPRHVYDDERDLILNRLLPLIDRYVDEQAAPVLPLVKAVVERHRDFPSEGKAINFDGPYVYSVRVWLKSDTLEAAQRWLVILEKAK